MPSVLLINGGVRGATGDSGRACGLARSLLHTRGVETDEIVLASCHDEMLTLRERLRKSDAMLFFTGTYWGSWGSPLQRFFELITADEGGELFLGKPGAAVVTMDSVGGSDVGARLLLALNLMGCAIPPLGLVVLSRVGLAVAEKPGFEDVWRESDLAVLISNLLAASVKTGASFHSWPIERAHGPQGAFPLWGPVDLGLPNVLGKTTRDDD